MERISIAGVAKRGDRYLLALRRPGSSIGESWEFPGGKVRSGETPEQALKREFQEELQVSILVGGQVCTSEFTNRGVHYTLKAYDIKVIGEAFTLSEHQETGWFTLSEIEHLPMADSDRSILEYLRSTK